MRLARRQKKFVTYLMKRSVVKHKHKRKKFLAPQSNNGSTMPKWRNNSASKSGNLSKNGLKVSVKPS